MMRIALCGALIVAACSEPDRRVEEAPPVVSRTFTPTTPNAEVKWWCGPDDDGFATCHRVMATCDRKRKMIFHQGNDPAPCRAAKGAACYELRAKVSGDTNRRCVESITLCKNLKDNILRGAAADFDVIVDCAVE